MLKLSRPLHLLLTALTYTLGASIPVYLGKPIQPLNFSVGLVVILLAQLSMNLLGEVFRPHNEPLIENQTPQQKQDLRNIALYISIASLTTCAVFAYILFINDQLPLTTFYFLLLSLLLIFAYAIPPIRLLNYGFGELALSVQIAYVIPSIALSLQTGGNHRLLSILITPLTALTLSYFLILNFTTFITDQKYQRATLLRRLTWERAVPLHHALIVFAYFMLAAAPLFGFSFELIWRAFLTLPFAIFQIIQLRAIANGNPPNWLLLHANALATFGLTVYFLTITFWIR